MRIVSKITRCLIECLAYAFAIFSPEILRAAIPLNHTIFEQDSLHTEASKVYSTIDTLSVKIFFHVSRSEIDLNLWDNGKRMEEYIEALRAADADPNRRIIHQHIVGYASPEGPYKLNRRLSHERADHIADYLRENYRLDDSLLTVIYGGVNWEGLYSALDTSSMKYATRVQEIIRNEPEFTYQEGKIVRSRNQRLMDLYGGRPWIWMTENIFPQLRYSASVVCYIETLSPEIEALTQSSTGDKLTARADRVPENILKRDIYQQEYDILSYPIFALRSNLLLPLHNFGVEVPVSKNWSVGLDYYYPWVWPNYHNKNCFELLFFSAEARYWFDPSRNQDFPERNYMLGHSVGVYGSWGYYDFERNYHGYQGDVMSIGVDYLYSKPIANGRMRLEFEAALGLKVSYHAQPYNVYKDGGRLIREKGHLKNFTYFGPSRLAVSLVIPINHKVKTYKTPAAL